MKISKNKEAEKLLGLRPEGTPIDLPYELGYACPICGASDEVNLDWSEYTAFLYCKRCNLDIPSCLCVKLRELGNPHRVMKKRDIIIKEIMLFLISVEDGIEYSKNGTLPHIK